MEYFKDENIVIMEKNGRKVKCDILFTFDSEDTMRSYVAFTDGSFDSRGRKNIYCGSISPFSFSNELQPLTDPREIEMFNDVLREIGVRF